MQHGVHFENILSLIAFIIDILIKAIHFLIKPQAYITLIPLNSSLIPTKRF